MDNTTNLRLWGMRLMFVAICMFIMFLNLLPISFLPNSRNWPDLMILFAIALVMRKENFLPFWLVGFTFLLADFLLTKPLGLDTFLALIGTQIVRRNQMWFQEMSFVLEWATVAMVLLGLTILRELIFILTFADGTPFLIWLSHLSVTIIVYPVAVWCVNVIFWAWKNEPDTSIFLGKKL